MKSAAFFGQSSAHNVWKYFISAFCWYCDYKKKRFLVFWAEQNSDHNNFFFLLTIWTEFPPEFYSNSHCESWGSWLQLMVIVLDRYIQVLFYLSTWLWADFKGSFKLSPLCSGKYCSRSLWSPSSIPLSTCSAFNYKIICDTW